MSSSSAAAAAAAAAADGAYRLLDASQAAVDQPGSNQAQLLADDVLAVRTFYAGLFAR
jgi:hypothetical protein